MKSNLNLTRIVKCSIVALAFFLIAIPEALATHKIYSPKVHKGQWEFEARGHVDFDDQDSKDNKQKYKYDIGYGVTDQWKTEVVFEVEKEAGKDEFDFKAVEWENIFQLSGEDALIDYGLYFAYEWKPDKDDEDKIEAKILLEKRINDIKHTANLIFEKEVWGDAGKELVGEFAWRSKYYWTKLVRPGFEYYIDFGELNDGNSYDEQEHQVGPMVYGKFGGHIEYELGYLFGISDSAPDGTLRWLLEYEIEF